MVVRIEEMHPVLASMLRSRMFSVSGTTFTDEEIDKALEDLGDEGMIEEVCDTLFGPLPVLTRAGEALGRIIARPGQEN